MGLQGAGFFIVTYISLAAAGYAALHLSEAGGKEGSSGAGGGDLLWQSLQLLGASAGSAVGLLIPGLAFCGGRRRERGGACRNMALLVGVGSYSAHKACAVLLPSPLVCCALPVI